MALNANHHVGDGGHVTDHNSIDAQLAALGNGYMCPTGGGGEMNFDRMLVNENTITLTSGVIMFGPAAKALTTETISQVTCMTGGTTAATVTYAAYGVYSVDDSGNLTRVAQTTSDTSNLWNVAFQGLNGINVKKSFTASWTKTAGVRYTIGALFVGTTAPTIGGCTPSSGDAATNLILPFRAAKLTGQSSLPASIAIGSLVGSGLSPFYALQP